MRTIVVIGSNEELNRSVRMAKEPKDVVVVETKINPFGIYGSVKIVSAGYEDYSRHTILDIPVNRKSHRRPYKYHK